MPDRNDLQSLFQSAPLRSGAAGWATKEKDKEKDQEQEQGAEEGEESCLAFGYQRGLRERALAVEFRFRDGNSEWFSYSLLGTWRHNPSTGLLLKFTGDVVTLVLIRGSNLDVLVNQSVNLPHGLQRHRILWVREMDEAELRRTGERGPTIDRIEVAECETTEEMHQWLKKVAPAFVRNRQP